MPYRFATEDQDYSDYASGRVIYNLPGLPAFPIRLASEIFLRAYRHLNLAGPHQRITLYDPTCGGAYHLTALGIRLGSNIETILASEINEPALALAARNLSLLSAAGLDRREQEIRGMFEKFGKESHAEALNSLVRLREQMKTHPPVRSRVFQANALDPAALRAGLAGETIDLVISDIPYGQLSSWAMTEETSPTRSPVWQMLDALRSNLPETAIVAVAADKSQKIAHEGYQRVERFQIGKRQVALLAPAAS